MILLGLFVDGLHCWEQQNIADRGGIRQQHDKAVHTEAEAARRRQAVFERGDVVVIDLRLAGRVERAALGHLALKASLLVNRIVQLGERVAEFHRVDEILEALRKGGVVRLALGERAVLHRIIVDKRRLDEVLLHERVEELREDRALCRDLRQRNLVGLRRFDRLGVGGDRREIDAAVLLDGLDHRHALPVAQVDRLALIRDLQRTADVLRHGFHHFLDEVHHAVVIGVRLIQLDRRELGVMLRVHALVAEDAAHLVDAVHAADDQALQIELSLDAQHHIHVERVVVREERTRRRADLKRRQNRCIDLEEALAVEVAAQLTQNLTALFEGVLHLGVHDQVHIALAVAHVRVRQAMVLLGQHLQALREQRDRSGLHGDFSGFGAENLAADADNVADIVLFEILIGLLADHVARNIRLDHAAEILHVAERGLAHDALCHHAAGDRDLLPLERLEIRPDRIAVMGDIVFRDRERVLAVLRELRELFAAQAQNLVDFLLRLLRRHFGHVLLSHLLFSFPFPG